MISQLRPYLQVTWHDPVTGRPGYLVIDRLVRGVCSGGLRMRDGCTLAEVAGLAAGMTAKEALNYDPHGRYVPLGGAKGGIDFDPQDPAATEAAFAKIRRTTRQLVTNVLSADEPPRLVAARLAAEAADAIASRFGPATV